MSRTLHNNVWAIKLLLGRWLNSFPFQLNYICYINNMKNILSRITSKINQKQRKEFRPVIISDIDGVLLRGKVPIQHTHQALKKIQQNKIPFACLTNGGGQLESTKTKKMNEIFGQELFQSNRMFMNHTPLRPQLLKYKKEGTILVTGSLKIQEILEKLSIENYITADEMFSIYFMKENKHQNQQSDYLLHERKHKKQIALEAVSKRMKRPISSHFADEAMKVNSIFALNDVTPYETSLQVIHNLLRIHHQNSDKPIEFYAAQNDIVWAGSYHKPRMAFGPFNYILQEHCKKHKFNLIQHIHFGKPEKKAFMFVENEMRKETPDGFFFMIGDNPRADIRGANNIGWESFLTRTGIHTEKGNSETDPASMVVENFAEAVDIIFKLKDQFEG